LLFSRRHVDVSLQINISHSAFLRFDGMGAFVDASGHGRRTALDHPPMACKIAAGTSFHHAPGAGMRVFFKAAVLCMPILFVLMDKPASAETLPAEPGSSPAANVQGAVLYEEDSSDPYGRRYAGSVIWRTETVSPGSGQPPELAISAEIEVPERKLAMTWSLRRNNDRTLPASHVVEIMLKLPADFPSGSVANVPGILMKPAELTRGVALAGIAVKVTGAYFMFGLSNNPPDKQRNLELLNDRGWVDLPMIYGNNRRAILAIEKGAAGTRVFDEVLAAWGQYQDVQQPGTSASPPK